MPRSLAMAIAMPLAGRLYNRAGPRLLIGLGLAVSAFSFWELSRLSLEVGFKDIVLPQFVQGIGFGMIFVSLSTVALSTISKQRMQAATGLYNVVRLIFGSVGIAVFATQLERGGQGYRAILVEHVTGYRDTALESLSALSRLMLSRGADLMTAREQALGLLSGEVMRQALMLSYNRVFFLVACLFTLSAPLIVLLRRVRTGVVGHAIVE
jgi:DHA2 family multidrug resistance protein